MEALEEWFYQEDPGDIQLDDAPKQKFGATAAPAWRFRIIK